MSASSCVVCGAEFPLNYELAAIPDAERIAFDPKRGRVWRVCTACGTWNLAGPPLTRTAMPELCLRVNSTNISVAEPGLDLAKIGKSLQLLRLNSSSGGTIHRLSWMASKEREKQKLADLKRARNWEIGLAVPFVMWFFWLGHLAAAIPVVGLFSIGALAHAGRNLRYG